MPACCCIQDYKSHCYYQRVNSFKLMEAKELWCPQILLSEGVTLDTNLLRTYLPLIYMLQSRNVDSVHLTKILLTRQFPRSQSRSAHTLCATPLQEYSEASYYSSGVSVGNLLSWLRVLIFCLFPPGTHWGSTSVRTWMSLQPFHGYSAATHALFLKSPLPRSLLTLP